MSRKSGGARSAANTTPPPVLYIYGDDDYLVDEALAAVKREALGGSAAGFESMNVQVFDAGSLSVAEVMAAARTLPAFAPARVVVIREAASLRAADQRAVLEYARDPSPTTRMVLVAHTRKVGRESRLFRYLSEKGAVKVCNRLSREGLARWVRRAAKGRGKEIAEEAVERLLDNTGTRLRDVRGELEKIMLFCGERTVVGLSDVADAGLECREDSIFDLTDAIGRRDAKKALELFARLSGEPPLMVLGAMARQFRILLKLKALDRAGAPPARIQKETGLWRSQVGNYRAMSARFGEEELVRALKRLQQADMALKTGSRPSLELTRVIVDLTGGIKRGSALPH
ncbi:MAG TPA: DNA polymerase III subunit delta [Deltaproteobacteria bacterium]|nr:DNA polymerase III subunit delta [Deltaproteobacteria bacterium]